jgi:hypothetical protein
VGTGQDMEGRNEVNNGLLKEGYEKELKVETAEL